MPSFSIALTGLESDNTSLNGIANNIANMSTTGYKAQTAQFSNLFLQQLGSNGAGDPIAVGTGTQIAATETNFSGGPVSSTGNASNVALQGNGFFVVEQGSTQEYTRAGDFQMANDGSLTTTGGAAVMGYLASGGAINVGSVVSPIVLPIGQVQPAKATSSMSIAANLNATAAVGTSETAPIALVDSLGVAHQATVSMTKTAANTWSYNISLPAGESTGSVNTSGTLSFDGSGNLVSPSGNVSGVGFTGMADGANNMSFSWNLYNAAGAPQVAQSASSWQGAASTTQDGYATGQYQDFSIGADGVVTASFSNGQNVSVGQLAIASVVNQQGLQAVNGSAYVTTTASGNATLGVAGSNGRGLVQDKALEGSNVDVSTEFSALIVAQRAFEANSKSITTFDTVTQEAINMIH
ncbi:MAG: flagellar hook protein FlgE [Acidobacteriaceae bacterium]